MEFGRHLIMWFLGSSEFGIFKQTTIKLNAKHLCIGSCFYWITEMLYHRHPTYTISIHVYVYVKIHSFIEMHEKFKIKSLLPLIGLSNLINIKDRNGHNRIEWNLFDVFGHGLKFILFSFIHTVHGCINQKVFHQSASKSLRSATFHHGIFIDRWNFGKSIQIVIELKFKTFFWGGMMHATIFFFWSAIGKDGEVEGAMAFLNNSMLAKRFEIIFIRT